MVGERRRNEKQEQKQRREKDEVKPGKEIGIEQSQE